MKIYRPETGPIFTIGAFCEPAQLTDSQGNKQWCWVVTEFENDSFRNGYYVYPKEYADTRENLMEEVEYDDDDSPSMEGIANFFGDT